MKRWAGIGALLLPVAVFALAMALRAEAKAPAGTGLQRVARGRDGVAAAGVLCQRVHQTRLCFPGTKPTRPSGGG